MDLNPNENSCSPSIQEKDSETAIRTPILPIRDILIEDRYYNLRPRQSESVGMLSKVPKGQRNSSRPFKSFSSLDFAKNLALSSQKWLMINLEHSVLTGIKLFDVLENNENYELKNIISGNFVLWEVYQHSRVGTRYKSFYGPVTEFPHVAILDPETGERLAVSHSFGPLVLKDFLYQFLSERPSPREDFSVMPLNSTNTSDTSSESTQTIPEKVNTNTTEPKKRKRENFNANDVSINNSKVSFLEADTVPDRHETSEIKEKIEFKDESEATYNSKTEFLSEYDGQKIEFIIRFPNGERHHTSWTLNTALHTLYVYIEEMGYYMSEWEVIALHPRRCLTLSDSTKTFKEANLYDKEVLFVQKITPP